jgi:hypothetical protein
MRKPTLKTFLMLYVAVWVALDIYMARQTLPYPFLGASIGNFIMVVINLIGLPFAICGHVPWRENDPPKRPKAARSQSSQSAPIIVDSADWTGR